MDNKYLEKAEEHLRLASNGLNKPEEDFIGFSVCKNAQLSIKNYLTAYLTKNGAMVDKKATLGQLFEQCKNIDPSFEEIDMSKINCIFDEDLNKSSCSELEKVSSCFNTADELDTFLRYKV